MSYSHIPPHPNFTQEAPIPISCTRCEKLFHTRNIFMMTCPDCHLRDVHYTVQLGNKTRIFQIEISLMQILIELSIFNISNNRKVVLERLVEQLEQEKQELSQNI
jgi:hypothetical protein